jgi:hypothetical protein
MIRTRAEKITDEGEGPPTVNLSLWRQVAQSTADVASPTACANIKRLGKLQASTKLVIPAVLNSPRLGALNSEGWSSFLTLIIQGKQKNGLPPSRQ